MDLSKDFKAIQDKVDRLQNLADTVIQPPMQLKKYPDPTSAKYRWSLYVDSSFGCFNILEYFFWRSSWPNKKEITEESLAKTLEQFDKTKQQWIDDCAEALEYNKTVVAHNKLQYERVESIMKTLGVPQTYTRSYFKTSRSTKLTTEKTNAVWPSEVSKTLPTKCNYLEYLKKIDDKRHTVETFGKNWIIDNKDRLWKEEKDKQLKEKEQRKLQVIAGLSVKHGLSFESSAGDILDVLLGKDKYLNLAYNLECNRNNWSDGCWYAERGLSSFTADTPEDNEIYKEIVNLCDDFEDGRVFRDCKWNYSVLYSMVDEDLYKDFTAIAEFV